MKAKAISRIVALIAVTALVLTSCGKGKDFSFSGGGEGAAPVKTVLKAILDGDGEAYFSAFPPAAVADYQDMNTLKAFFYCNDIESYLDTLLGVYEENYGAGVRIKAKITAEEQVTVDAVKNGNPDYYTFKSYVTEDNTEEVCKISLELKVSGKRDSDTYTVLLYTVKQDGVWYLHPMFAFSSF